MANLKDYGIRFISHGMWADAEIRWKKSKFQTLLFNYEDVAECTEYESLDLTDNKDLRELVSQLSELTPSGYGLPQIYYEWEIETDEGNLYDDGDFYKRHNMSNKEDFVLHTTGQALRQALQFLDERNIADASITIYRRDDGTQKLVANYYTEGGTLKDFMCYKKK